MNHLDFYRAMLDEPDDDLVRLAFADWLEERGEVSRAAWVRLSVAAAVGPDREASWRLRADADAAFARCWPAAWADVPNVSRGQDRGRVALTVRTKTALTKLGGCAWLPAAHAAGWLGPVSVGMLRGDFSAALAAAWRRRAAGLPLAASVELYVGTHRDWVFAHPDLTELSLRVCRAAPELPGQLAACARLRTLSVTGGDVTDARAVPGLRRLTVSGWMYDANGQATATLLSLADHPTLRRLVVWNCPAITPAGLDAFRAAAPHVTVDRRD